MAQFSVKVNDKTFHDRDEAMDAVREAYSAWKAPAVEKQIAEALAKGERAAEERTGGTAEVRGGRASAQAEED